FVSLTSSFLFSRLTFLSLSFFFTVTATTEFYTLSLHDALPIFVVERPGEPEPFAHTIAQRHVGPAEVRREEDDALFRVERPEKGDRKSTRLNSSHDQISYAVFCLKKKKKT